MLNKETKRQDMTSKQSGKESPPKTGKLIKSDAPSGGGRKGTKLSRAEILFKEKIESVNSALADIQNADDDENKDKLQGTFKIIFDDILDLLKLLLEVKNPGLISNYKKAIKGIENFRKELNFEDGDDYTEDNTDKDSVYDEDTIIVEKVTKLGNWYFREKHKDGKIIIGEIPTGGIGKCYEIRHGEIINYTANSFLTLKKKSMISQTASFLFSLEDFRTTKMILK